jgi:hypothetical protein
MQVLIPRPAPGAICPGLGNVYAMYDRLESAMYARKQIVGRMFNGRTIECTYFLEDKLERQDFYVN